jgi:hypothetical protein
MQDKGTVVVGGKMGDFSFSACLAAARGAGDTVGEKCGLNDEAGDLLLR